MTRRLLTWLGLICVLIGLMPMISVLIASGIADAYGCTLNEAAIHPCTVAGRDIGALLGTMFVAGWFMIITLPVALAGSVLLVLLALTALFHRLR